MRSFLLGTLLLLLAPFAAADAFEAECESTLPRADIQVVAQKVDPEVDFSKSFLEITRNANSSLESTQFAMGVTLTELARDIRTDFHAKQTFLGRLCVRAKLRVTLSYAPMRVYIAKEFGEQSCYAQEIYLHEMHHVRVYETFLRRYAVRLQDLLVGALGQDVYYFDSEAAARTTLQTVVDSQLTILLNRSVQDINEAQRRVDSDIEIERLGKACPFEKEKIRRLATAFNQQKNWEKAE